MSRLTKRTKEGGVSVDWTDAVLEKLAAYEDVDDTPDGIREMKDFCDLITSLPSCNDCINRTCGKIPKMGEPVRWNCPLWKGRDKCDDIVTKKEN